MKFEKKKVRELIFHFSLNFKSPTNVLAHLLKYFKLLGAPHPTTYLHPRLLPTVVELGFQFKGGQN